MLNENKASIQRWATEHPKESYWIAEFEVRSRIGYFPEDKNKQLFYILYNKILTEIETKSLRG